MPGVNIRRVGVIYRDFMENSIRTNRIYCRKEHINLISYPISNNKDLDKELEKGLNYLKNKVDALWVLNDSRLINVKFLR